MENTERSIKDTWDMNKKSNTHVTGFPEAKERQSKAEAKQNSQEWYKTEKKKNKHINL